MEIENIIKIENIMKIYKKFNGFLPKS